MPGNTQIFEPPNITQLPLPRSQEERYQDAICQSTAVASCIDPKANASSVIAAKVWKGSAKGKVPEAFAICGAGAATRQRFDGFALSLEC